MATHVPYLGLVALDLIHSLWITFRGLPSYPDESEDTMTTSIDALAFIHQNFHTTGNVQRQKILYYSQAWHLVWNGSPLFNDQVKAWRMGPVVETAWRLEKSWAMNPVSNYWMTNEEMATVNAVWSFYGQFNGNQLSELTHSEQPWIERYTNVSPLIRGSGEITKADMRTFYSLKAINGESRPIKPAQHAAIANDDQVSSIVAFEEDRWSSFLSLLADR